MLTHLTPMSKLENRLVPVDCDDGTPDVTEMDYDRAGRLAQLRDAAGLRPFAWEDMETKALRIVLGYMSTHRHADQNDGLMRKPSDEILLAQLQKNRMRRNLQVRIREAANKFAECQRDFDGKPYTKAVKAQVNAESGELLDKIDEILKRPSGPPFSFPGRR